MPCNLSLPFPYFLFFPQLFCVILLLTGGLLFSAVVLLGKYQVFVLEQESMAVYVSCAVYNSKETKQIPAHRHKQRNMLNWFYFNHKGLFTTTLQRKNEKRLTLKSWNPFAPT